jgi:hypothetical protein
MVEMGRKPKPDINYREADRDFPGGIESRRVPVTQTELDRARPNRRRNPRDVIDLVPFDADVARYTE